MKTKLLIFLIAIVILSVTSCVFVLSMDHVKASGDVVKEIRGAENYTSISVSSGLKAIVSQTGNYSVEIEANENFMEYIIVEVKENTLYLKVENGKNLTGGTKNIYVEIDAIKNIGVSSGAKVKSEGILKGSNMEVNASSGAHADLHIDSEDIDVNASSGAHIDIKGKTSNQLDADASSGAKITASEFNGIELDANVSSGAHINVGHFEKINADASSGGHISYSGDPEEIDVNKSSGGNVSKR